MCVCVCLRIVFYTRVSNYYDLRLNNDQVNANVLNHALVDSLAWQI